MKRAARQFRLRSLMVVVALLAGDSALLLRAPLPWAFAALFATVMVVVSFAARALVRYGSDGRGKTLY